MISMNPLKQRETTWEAFVVGSWWANWILTILLIILLLTGSKCL